MLKIVNNIVAVVLVLSCATLSKAGDIASVSSVSGPGLLSSDTADLPLFSFAPNNDDDALGLDNFGTYDITFGATDYVDLVIDVSNTGGVTEFLLSGFMRNSTPDTWDKIELILGFGTGSAFTTANLGDLDFDTDPIGPEKSPAPTGSNLSQILHTPGLIRASAGLNAPPGHLEALSYSIDIPDNLPDGKFTIRHQPMPEPAGAVLLFVGAVFAAQRRRHTR